MSINNENRDDKMNKNIKGINNKKLIRTIIGNQNGNVNEKSNWEC